MLGTFVVLDHHPIVSSLASLLFLLFWLICLSIDKTFWKLFHLGKCWYCFSSVTCFHSSMSRHASSASFPSGFDLQIIQAYYLAVQSLIFAPSLLFHFFKLSLQILQNVILVSLWPCQNEVIWSNYKCGSSFTTSANLVEIQCSSLCATLT